MREARSSRKIMMRFILVPVHILNSTSTSRLLLLVVVVVVSTSTSITAFALLPQLLFQKLTNGLLAGDRNH